MAFDLGDLLWVTGMLAAPAIAHLLRGPRSKRRRRKPAAAVWDDVTVNAPLPRLPDPLPYAAVSPTRPAPKPAPQPARCPNCGGPARTMLPCPYCGVCLPHAATAPVAPAGNVVPLAAGAFLRARGKDPGQPPNMGSGGRRPAPAGRAAEYRAGDTVVSFPRKLPPGQRPPIKPEDLQTLVTAAEWERFKADLARYGEAAITVAVSGKCGPLNLVAGQLVLVQDGPPDLPAKPGPGKPRPMKL